MKKYMTRAMAMGMVFSMVGGTMAFAQGQEAEDIRVIKADLTTTAEELKADAYTTQNGKVTTVTKTEDGAYQVLIENETGGLRFLVSANTVIADRATGSLITADQLTEGMEVSVVYAENSPMGMSMPPYLADVTAIVANADKGSFVVGNFDEKLFSQNDNLVLNIGEDTKIQSTLGTKKAFTASDIQNKNAVVFYDITTRSLPAQTTPSFVLILEEEVVVEEKTELVSLRDTAEGMGYDVKWQGKAKPILVENEEVTMEITVGTAKYVVDGKEMVADMAATLVDGVLYVSSDVLA